MEGKTETKPKKKKKKHDACVSSPSGRRARAADIRSSIVSDVESCLFLSHRCLPRCFGRSRARAFSPLPFPAEEELPACLPAWVEEGVSYLAPFLFFFLRPRKPLIMSSSSSSWLSSSPPPSVASALASSTASTNSPAAASAHVHPSTCLSLCAMVWLYAAARSGVSILARSRVDAREDREGSPALASDGSNEATVPVG
ncbi:hypothetical protein GGS23DRAFT_590116 [Durotheca rogersii]|uniref:uncharacterized protein n=1 Tax=Durotheca rogersii TaxID=419775 RepID=UPI00221F1BFC|nr:uncharacterized protein GGS23DRAFT_590116 [Durotheca rogersii]KAI5855082.1 hypothetical protein GGS23DRAFT_590116 [Durotheca rogersii]